MGSLVFQQTPSSPSHHTQMGVRDMDKLCCGSSRPNGVVCVMQLITHSPTLPYMVPTLVLSLLCYNIAGMFVTDEIGAVARTVLETMRTLFVWIVDLVLWYTPLGLGRLGEKWDNYSYLQLVG